MWLIYHQIHTKSIQSLSIQKQQPNISKYKKAKKSDHSEYHMYQTHHLLQKNLRIIIIPNKENMKIWHPKHILKACNKRLKKRLIMNMIKMK